MIKATNIPGFGGAAHMYYTPGTSTSFAASPSLLGSYAAVEPAVVIAAGLHFVDGSGGVFKSHDNGQNWASVGTPVL
jgi:hypothetical protein